MSLYGRLSFPSHPTRPHVIGNFVASIDGVVSLNEPGRAGGGEISGFDPHDRMLMGLLRAVSDDELFLTMAPQVAKRAADSAARPATWPRGELSPHRHPLWGTLVGLKKGGSHLFLRCSFGAR